MASVHSPASWQYLQSWDTLYSADSIEFCPVSPHQHVFLCGTYQLTEAGDNSPKTGSDKRKGTLLLFHLNETEQRVELIRTVETAAILDIKWSHCRVQDKVVFAVVNAIGQLIVYELVDSSTPDTPFNLDIIELCSHQLDRGEASEILALSLDWSSRMSANGTGDSRSVPSDSEDFLSSSADRIVVSDSHGQVHLFELGEAGLSLESSWKSHGFEAWIAAFNYAQPSIFYSGGDDCLMKVYDARQSKPVQIVREHEAGVTSIQHNPFSQHGLATGSYDEHLYIWDDRNLKSARTKINLGGGVWRIKHQSESSILTATMYNGFHFVQWGSEGVGEGRSGRHGDGVKNRVVDPSIVDYIGKPLEVDKNELVPNEKDSTKTLQTEDSNIRDAKSKVQDENSNSGNAIEHVKTCQQDSNAKDSRPKLDDNAQDDSNSGDPTPIVQDDIRVAHYTGHGSIAYGVDSCYAHQTYVVTCSFYDHLMHLSKLE